MATTSKESAVHDVPVLLEDQQKINKFARLNASLEDILEEVKTKEKELLDLEDAESDLLMAESDLVPYKLGQIFVSLSTAAVQQNIDESKQALKEEIIALKEQRSEIKEEMSTLRRQLYNKFGDNINLEVDDV